ncbi:hypothetical protein FHU43_0616 [Halopolyspora algeriensis]|nr:hypothetical protein FHU43_0616 [Halopolyspora algeriensis]
MDLLLPLCRRHRQEGARDGGATRAARRARGTVLPGQRNAGTAPAHVWTGLRALPVTRCLRWAAIRTGALAAP